MKKLTLLFSIVLITAASFGQELDNQFYFRVGYSSPSWTQFGLTQDEFNDVGFDSKTGAVFEVGSIFMIQRWTEENMALGINVDYLYLNYGNFSGEEGGYEQNLGNLRVGSKVGPSFTYSPVNGMAFDVYLKADIAWAAGVLFYEDAIMDAESDEIFHGYGTVGLSTGLNFRYGILMLGFEYNTISPKLENYEIDGVYLQEMIDTEFGTNGDKKSKLPCLNFTVGLSF